MKVKVSNLGPIRGPAEFDLKPLTILIGPNNAGKTWLVYTLGGVFSTYGISRYVRGDEIEDISKNYLSLTKAIDDLLTTGIAKIDLCQFTDEYSETYFNNIASHAVEWLFEFMSTQQVSFNELELSIKLEETKQQIIDRVLASPLKSDIGLKKQTSDIDEDPKPLLRINKRKGQRELHLYTFSEGHIDEKIPRELIEEHLAWNVLHIVHQALYSGVMFLPTERATFLPFLPSRFNLLAKTANTEEVGKGYNYMKPLSVPVATYLDFG